MNSVDTNHNKRSYARVNIKLDMHLVLVDADAAGLINGKDRIRLRRGTISDLSAAGIKVSTKEINHNLEPHLISGAVTLAVRFTLPGHNTPISATAKAVRFKQIIDLGGRSCTMGLKFVDIDPQDQNAIHAFVAQQQNGG